MKKFILFPQIIVLFFIYGCIKNGSDKTLHSIIGKYKCDCYTNIHYTPIGSNPYNEEYFFQKYQEAIDINDSMIYIIVYKDSFSNIESKSEFFITKDSIFELPKSPVFRRSGAFYIDSFNTYEYGIYGSASLGIFSNEYANCKKIKN